MENWQGLIRNHSTVCSVRGVESKTVWLVAAAFTPTDTSRHFGRTSVCFVMLLRRGWNAGLGSEASCYQSCPEKRCSSEAAFSDQCHVSGKCCFFCQTSRCPVLCGFSPPHSERGVGDSLKLGRHWVLFPEEARPRGCTHLAEPPGACTVSETKARCSGR